MMQMWVSDSRLLNSGAYVNIEIEDVTVPGAYVHPYQALSLIVPMQSLFPCPHVYSVYKLLRVLRMCQSLFSALTKEPS